MGVLYLAEVNKKSGFRGGRAELRLLARQQSEQSWSAMPAEELLPAEAANHFNAGALVFVELNPSRQIQTINEAARQLVGILQNFSRLREKFRTQEEEIEGWKQSLIFQAQELGRREVELESQQEELQLLEAEAKKLEQERLATAASSAAAQQLQEEAERNRQELEGAWEHLRREMRRLEDQQERSTTLDAGQVRRIEELLNRLALTTALPESIQGQLPFSLELLRQQQAMLDQYWHQLEQQRISAHSEQAEVDRQAGELENTWQAWQAAQDALEQARIAFKLQRHSLRFQADSRQNLTLQAQAQSELYQQLHCIVKGFESQEFNQQVDWQAVEQMTLEELQATVDSLQQGLEGLSRFVQDQEEELALQQQAIEELKELINQASEYDRLSLEGDLEFEQQSYQMLNETLIGQRRTLQEREEILHQHQAILLRRQQSPPQANESNLEPVLLQLKSQRQQLAAELQKLQTQVDQAQATIQQSQAELEQQSRDQEAKHHELKQWELALQSQKLALAERWGNTNAYQAILQPLQDRLNKLRQALSEIDASLTQAHPGAEQKQAIAELRSFVTSLAQFPEMAAS